uniref:Uncharacterized protein n=1 Tax=Ralstonia syzygii R24 TaxID=907261 RepID=G3A5B5_9RALS|nr:hypothetical protein RALSY_30912 [Ralstonia syzygii R24]
MSPGRAPRRPARAASSGCVGMRGPVLVVVRTGRLRTRAGVLLTVVSRWFLYAWRRGLRVDRARLIGVRAVRAFTVRRHLERRIVARKWPFHAANRIPVICKRI